MDTTTSPMDIDNDDSLSDTDTCYYHDQDIDLSGWLSHYLFDVLFVEL